MSTQDKIIKIKQLSEIMGVSVSTTRRMVKGRFLPQPIEIPGTTRKGWSLNQINECLENIKTRRQEPALPHAKTWRVDQNVNFKNKKD